MKKITTKNQLIVTMLTLLVLACGSRGEAAVQAAYQYNLANFSGTVPSMWAKLAIDKERREIFTLDRHERQVRIFNEYGMEVYDFGEDINLAGGVDITLGADGDIYVLFRNRPDQSILQLDYRGEPIAAIALQNIPEEFLPFKPELLEYSQGHFYLVDSGSMDIIVTDNQGVFLQGYKVQSMLAKMEEVFEERAPKEKRHTGVAINGFSVDVRGNMYFTIPVLFSAFRMSPAGDLESFGRSGSAPGKFGVVAGIVADEQGNICVADRLRSVVIVFDDSFNFITEFGYRGLKAANLIVPDDVVIDRTGTIYVSQAANRGVSVFSIVYN
jgi:hypothetical protein